MTFQGFWHGMDARGRIALALGTGVVAIALASGVWWLLRGEEAVLFSDLRPEDAALMAGELDRLKVPYTVSDDGGTLRVDASLVHATRLKLMGRDLPLHGAVGLELFDHSDFGMTEFAQKINYQRALQGELTRTILSFPEVREVRVHLALPEQGLLRPASTRPKAAVTVTLRHGQALRPEQVSGIQRLVAAAVPGLVAQEVTVVDPQGVALSRPAADAEGVAPVAGGLDLKRETEQYLARKATAVLARAFGPGQVLASVDATLDMDQVRVTTEDVLAAPESRAGQRRGVLVRERESSRDGGGAEPGGSRGSSLQREADYQAGKRVEQVVSQPGAIQRLQVLAVVGQALDASQQDQLRALVGAAVGAVPERGDSVVVQSIQAVSAPAAAPQAPAPAASAAPARSSPTFGRSVLPLAAGLLALAGVVALGLLGLRARRPASAAREVPRALGEAERQLALAKVQAWLQEPAAPGAPSRSGAPFP